jgi:hypothetical protein
MKRLLPLAIALVVVWFWQRAGEDNAPAAGEPPGAGFRQAGAAPVTAGEDWRSGNQVTGGGTVIRILDDDDDGSRHQRFILEIGSGRTLLIAHNIDLAPRVEGLRAGDRVEFNGEYEWNDRGGVIHWTHHDPQGEHEPGWLKHNGRVYQ